MGRETRQMNAIDKFLEKTDTEGISPSELTTFKCMALWAMNYFDEYNGDVLIATCKTGLLACFIAAMNEDKSFTAIDFEAERIEKAEKYKAQLALSNIEFKVSDFTDLGRRFDTVLLFDTVGENVEPDSNALRFKKFNVQVNEFKNAYAGYADALQELTAPSGKLIAVEGIDPGTEFYGALSAFNAYGFKYLDNKTGSMEFTDPASQNKVSYLAFQLKNELENPEELFKKWAEKQLGNDMTPAKADYILFTNGGRRIEGYDGYDNYVQVVSSGIYENKEDPGSFFIYRASKKGKNILRYPQNRMNEAKLTISRDKEIDKKNGLNIIEFSKEGKTNIDFTFKK